MSTVEKPMYRWNELPWKEIERAVFKLQKRIYRASQRGDTKTVHKLQKLLTKSWSAKCLAVRKVTQDNQGKKTAGIDGIKSLTPKQRLALVTELNLNQKILPARRVWIPKPGAKGEQRGLGIPTIANRALQTLVKLALEAEWEAKFEPNSYGFRPGRSAHDAIEAIFNVICRKAKYVLDADIAKCFDRIGHQPLLNKLATYPVLRRLIGGWLKAGIMDGNQLFPTNEGTPQGSPVSPLLANIALHGLETAIRAAYPINIIRDGKFTGNWKPHIIRYADDFVILHQDLAVIEACKQLTEKWLSEFGLELKPSKTSITHTLHPYQGKIGFNFLGWSVRQYSVGKNHTGYFVNKGRRYPIGFKTLIKPSKEGLMRHLTRIKEVINRHKTLPQQKLIQKLNPIIRGWANYYASGVSSASFNKADYLIYPKLNQWAKQRHPHKTGQWRYHKYWRTIGNNRWTFATATGVILYRHTQTPIVRHIKVKDRKSPFDGDWVYWASRLGRFPGIGKTKALLLKCQKGRCPRCELYFKEEDLLEVDHIVPKHKGGTSSYTNQQILHRHCHDAKTRLDKSRR